MRFRFEIFQSPFEIFKVNFRNEIFLQKCGFDFRNEIFSCDLQVLFAGFSADLRSKRADLRRNELQLN